MNNRVGKYLLTTIAGLAVVTTLYGACGCGTEKKETRNLFAMDTVMIITAYGDNATEALDVAEECIKDIEAKVSATIESSEVYALNTTKSIGASEDVYDLIKDSVEIGEMTDGVFDVSIYPVMKAWGFTTDENRVPDADELEGLLSAVDFKKITFDDATCTITIPSDMEIELGGITKGYTSAKVAQVFKEYGISSALINLGGNIEVLGTKPDGSDWNIGIEDPIDTSDYALALTVTDKAVVTSGAYERYFEEDGVTYHHIIDPATGYPSDSGLASVTIVSADGTLADGLSTSLFIMGYDKAVEFWREHSDVFDVILIDNEKNIYVTEGIADDISTDTEYTLITNAP
ncbi:MAG: FAD:protein FMN transferase [Lachnospiraceae bacterium]|nr:FAD:protein FMN transferase [Lachnospiraceae bacterium]